MEMIITQHPTSTTGVRLSKDVYWTVAALMMQEIREKEVTLAFLIASLERQLKNEFPQIVFITYHVRLDLEAKGLIKRIPSTFHPKISVYRLTWKGLRLSEKKN